MKRNVLLAFVVVMSAVVTAAPQTQTSSKSSATMPVVAIPFELVIGHIMLQVKIDNSRPLSFVFDTGDKVAIVDAARARELGLDLQGQIKVGGAGSSFLTGSFVQGSKWTLPGLAGFSQPVTLALPLEKLAARFGHDFDGIIGSDFIKQFVIEVDYQARVIRLHDKDKFSYTGPGESIPIELDGQGHPVLEAEATALGGQLLKGKFVLDLGSGGGLAFHSPFVVEHQLPGPGGKTIRLIGSGGAGGQSVGQIGRVSELRIGRFKIPNPTAVFSEDKSGAFASKSLAGNIGQRIAGKFKLFLDYNRQRIIFEPNTTFDEPLGRAFSGLVFTGEDKDYSTLRITDVLENSPASEVGLQKNDIIIKVDDVPASELTVTKLAEMFERPVVYKLAIRRGEQILQVKLTPRKLV